MRTRALTLVSIATIVAIALAAACAPAAAPPPEMEMEEPVEVVKEAVEVEAEVVADAPAEESPSEAPAADEGADAPAVVAGAGGAMPVRRERLIIKDGELQPDPFLDITHLVDSDSPEAVLGCLAFHPQYQVNGFFYVTYTDLVSRSIVARFQVTADPQVAATLAPSGTLAPNARRSTSRGTAGGRSPISRSVTSCCTMVITLLLSQ